MAETGEVQLHFLDYWRVVKNRWGIITLTFLLVVVTAYVTTYFLPRKYTSQCTIEVKSNDKIVQITGRDNYSGGVDPHFVSDQLHILQSTGILYPVIDELDLVKKWSAGLPQSLNRDGAYGMLVGMMRGIQEVRNTDMIVIPVTSTDKQEAADIANTIAVIYQKTRKDDLEQSINNALQELQVEVDKQRDKVDQAEKEVARIRVRDNIVDPNPDTLEQGDTEAERQYLAEEQKLNEAKSRTEEQKSLIDKINTMTPEEVLSSLTLFNIPDTTVSELLPKVKESRSDRARLIEEGLGENHPTIKSIDAGMEIWKKQLDEAVDSIKQNLQRRYDIALNFQDGEQKIFDAAKERVQQVKNQSTDYLNAKEAYINARALYLAAEQKLAADKMDLQIELVPAKIWDRAEPAGRPSSPNVAFYLVVAFIVGLGMGVGLAFFLEYLDTSVKTLADVEKFIGVSVLAVVPKIGGLLHKAEAGRSPDAETYRTLRTNIDFHKPSPDANTLTVISGGPGEGKSTTLCNLAVICANAGSNVLIVDADLRRPSQHKFFDMDGTVGLVNYVAGEKEFDDVIFQTTVENLWLIPSGSLTKDPVAILNSHRVVELIARAKTQFDMVLFDSPPILGLSDGAVLSSVAEMTVMVVQHRRFPRASLLRVKQSVLNVGGNLTGVVLNRVDTRDDQNYYYYTSYYDYYTPIPTEDRNASKSDL